MANEQLIYGGLFSLVTSATTAYFTWRQTTKVAETQGRAERDKAQAQVGVKKLENESALQNHFHSDLVSERDRANKLAADLQESQMLRFKAEAQLDTCKSERDGWEKEKDELREEISTLRHASRTLDTRLQGLEWLENAMADPVQLEQLLMVAKRRLEASRDTPPQLDVAISAGD